MDRMRNCRGKPEPGHLQVDLVRHSGSTQGGDWLHTVEMSDAAAGWFEQPASLGGSERAMEYGFLTKPGFLYNGRQKGSGYAE
jgi:hypothetical protein